MVKRLTLLLAPLFLVGCMSHPPPPPAPYHAFGKDSRWDLIIDDRHVTFIAAGRQPILQPTPQPIIGIAGEIYQTPRINVNIVHGSCTIGNRTYADRVQVSVDDAAHEGCGGTASAVIDGDATATLAGTRWRIAQVNGRQTPATGDYSISFTDTDMGARAGCNSMGGNYMLAGRTLTVSDLASTLIGCPEPAATFEQQVSRVLGRPMQIEAREGGRLVLSNDAGTISLTRS